MSNKSNPDKVEMVNDFTAATLYDIPEMLSRNAKYRILRANFVCSLITVQKKLTTNKILNEPLSEEEEVLFDKAIEEFKAIIVPIVEQEQFTPPANWNPTAQLSTTSHGGIFKDTTIVAMCQYKNEHYSKNYTAASLHPETKELIKQLNFTTDHFELPAEWKDAPNRNNRDYSLVSPKLNPQSFLVPCPISNPIIKIDMDNALKLLEIRDYIYSRTNTHEKLLEFRREACSPLTAYETAIFDAGIQMIDNTRIDVNNGVYDLLNWYCQTNHTSELLFLPELTRTIPNEALRYTNANFYKHARFDTTLSDTLQLWIEPAIKKETDKTKIKQDYSNVWNSPNSNNTMLITSTPNNPDIPDPALEQELNHLNRVLKDVPNHNKFDEVSMFPVSCSTVEQGQPVDLPIIDNPANLHKLVHDNLLSDRIQAGQIARHRIQNITGNLHGANEQAARYRMRPPNSLTEVDQFLALCHTQLQLHRKQCHKKVCITSYAYVTAHGALALFLNNIDEPLYLLLEEHMPLAVTKALSYSMNPELHTVLVNLAKRLSPKQIFGVNQEMLDLDKHLNMLSRINSQYNYCSFDPINEE